MGSGWMVHRLKDGFKFFYNVHSRKHEWKRPDGVSKDNSLLSREEIQVIPCTHLKSFSVVIAIKCVYCYWLKLMSRFKCVYWDWLTLMSHY